MLSAAGGVLWGLGCREELSWLHRGTWRAQDQGPEALPHVHSQARRHPELPARGRLLPSAPPSSSLQAVVSWGGAGLKCAGQPVGSDVGTKAICAQGEADVTERSHTRRKVSSAPSSISQPSPSLQKKPVNHLVLLPPEKMYLRLQTCARLWGCGEEAVSWWPRTASSLHPSPISQCPFCPQNSHYPCAGAMLCQPPRQALWAAIP